MERLQVYHPHFTLQVRKKGGKEVSFINESHPLIRGEQLAYYFFNTMVKKEYIQRADSKQTITGYTFNPKQQSIYENFSFGAVLQLVDKDPVARGALNRFVDRCMAGDMFSVKRDSLQYDEEFTRKLQKDFNFRTSVIRKIFLMGKMYQNVFVEIIRKEDGSAKEINVLDTHRVGPITKPNGDLKMLREKLPNPVTGEQAEWPETDIVWIKFNDRTQGFAPVDFQSLWETLLLKDHVREFLGWAWKTGQYRTEYNFKNAGEQDVLDFISYLKRVENDFRKPIIRKGEGEHSILRDIKELESIDLLLKYLDNQIAIALGVPPNDLGIPDTSGRSNADAQTNNFETSVRSFKTIVEDFISNELFPKINKGNNLWKFGPTDRFVEKQAYEILQLMGSLNMTEEVMREYLMDRGIVFKSKTLFKKPEEMLMPSKAGPDNPRDKDTAPSRAGKGTGEGNQNQEAVTTREDQIKKV